MYNNFLGLFYEPSEEHQLLVDERRKPNKIPNHEYDHVRYGLPTGALRHEENKEAIQLLVDHYFKYGYDTWPASKLNTNFKRHIALFRARLDIWEQFSDHKVFSKDEIYIRSLREGPAFGEFIKKARSTCLRAKSSETETEIEEEYYFDDYDGYNSIIHEKYLIHWDNTQNVDDIKYAFIPATRNRDDDFRKMIDTFWEDFRLDETEWPDEFDMVGALKNTKMYDPVKKKSFLMRDFWTKDIDPRSPYFAKRTVVPVGVENDRDTGVGDPGTILKVKQLNALARALSERIPYSANAPGPVCNARYKRVLKKNAFLHLDFKKYGLTFPRRLTNLLIERIERSADIDLSHLKISDFYVEIDGETYRTERGTMLGWLDSINAICVSVILHFLSKERELNFDFIGFNDDVEISKRCESALPETLQLLKLAIVAELDSFDIPISMKKTFGSRASVFLERYAYFSEEYQLDMYKEQLTVDAYAKSLVTEFPWQAKMFFSAAWQWTKHDYVRDRCIDTCPIEFRKDEIHLSLWAGGWYIHKANGLDTSLNETDRLGFRLGIELAKFRPPRYATPRNKSSESDKIYRKVNNNAYNSMSPEYGRMILKVNETISSLNEDYELLHYSAETLSSVYSGRNQGFALTVLRIVEEHPWEGGEYG